MFDTGYFSRPIFVTGLPRSGTSMVAGCLQACGTWLGTTVPGGIGNPKGFFENLYIREQLIKPLLVRLGCDPLGVKTLPDFKQTPNVHGLEQAYQQLLVKDGYQGDKPWLYKDAKLSLLWPLVNQSFPEARWVIVERNEGDIIDSCIRTHFMAQHSKSRPFWQSFVEQYRLRLDALKNSTPKVYSLSADNLISGHCDEILTLASTLGLTPNPTAIKDFISPSLWQANRC